METKTECGRWLSFPLHHNKTRLQVVHVRFHWAQTPLFIVQLCKPFTFQDESTPKVNLASPLDKITLLTREMTVPSALSSSNSLFSVPINALPLVFSSGVWRREWERGQSVRHGGENGGWWMGAFMRLTWMRCCFLVSFCWWWRWIRWKGWQEAGEAGSQHRRWRRSAARFGCTRWESTVRLPTIHPTLNVSRSRWWLFKELLLSCS